MSSSSLTREFLENEEPKLDAALKSFYSWIVASFSSQPYDHNHHHQFVQSPTMDTTTALSCIRSLSKAINSHVMALDAFATKSSISSPSTDLRSLGGRVWNEQAAMPGTRITKILGRTSLRVAWSNDLKQEALQQYHHTLSRPLSNQKVSAEKQKLGRQQDDDENEPGDNNIMSDFLDLFEQLLFLHPSSASRNNNVTFNNINDATAAATLIWGTPQEQQKELARRAAARQAAAQRRIQEQQKQQQQKQQTPTIQELPEQEEEQDLKENQKQVQ